VTVSLRVALGLTALTFAACTRAPVSTAPTSTPNSGLEALVRDAIVQRACRQLIGSYQGVPSPSEADAKGGTFLIEECDVRESGPRISLNVAGVVWEGERRPLPTSMAGVDEPLALALRGSIEADVVAGFDPGTGTVAVWLHPGSVASATASPVGPQVISSRGFFGFFADLLGLLEPRIASEVRARGRAEFAGKLQEGMTVFFDPRGLQLDTAPGLQVTPPRRPFGATSWAVNETVFLGRNAAMVRGPFAPSAFIRVHGTSRGGTGHLGVVCADTLGGMSAAVRGQGSAGATALVRAASPMGYLTDGSVHDVPAMPCQWVVVMTSGAGQVYADVLVTREPT
jgi:hypothetical protein